MDWSSQGQCQELSLFMASSLGVRDVGFRAHVANDTSSRPETLGIMDLKVVTVSGHTQTQNTFPYISDIIQMP